MQTKDNMMINNNTAGKSYPVVDPTTELIINKRMRPGRYNLYLLTEYGATAHLEKGIPAMVRAATDGGTPKPPMLGPARIDDSPCYELKVGGPTLTNRIISSNIFANAIGLSGNRRTIIISLLVGLLLGGFLTAWFFLLFT